MMELDEEKDRATIDEWYAQSKTQTVDTVAEFIRHLATDYNHDYGTICHAIAAAGLAAMRAVDHGPQGGITGFQAGAIQWENIKHWGAFGHKDAPMRFVDYSNMLYPQYEGKFAAKTISQNTWEYLQVEAAKNLAETPDAAVAGHWRSIVDGVVPFGFSVEAGE